MSPGGGLFHHKGLPSLQSLDLGDTKITDGGLEYLKGLTNLETLDLMKTQVTDIGLERLTGLNQLRELDLRGTKVTDAGVKELQQALPNCKIAESAASDAAPTAPKADNQSDKDAAAKPADEVSPASDQPATREGAKTESKPAPRELMSAADVAQSNESGPKAIVDRLLDRAGVVHSGRFEYRVTDTLGVTPANKPHEQHLEFVVSGPSWRLDDLDYHVERINHRGKHLEVHRTPQPDGSIRTSLEIHDTQAVPETPPCPPYFAGTFWYTTTINYIAAHKSDARLAGDKTVDGIATKVVEWDVSEHNKFLAFNSITQPLMKGGVLRLFVAPQFGYALPCVEYVDGEGFVANRFDATDFQEVTKGLFMPKCFSCQVFEKDGTLGWCERYKILRTENINAFIPGVAFSTNLPAGTIVADRRTGNSVDYVLDRSLEAHDFDLDRSPKKCGNPVRSHIACFYPNGNWEATFGVWIEWLISQFGKAL